MSQTTLSIRMDADIKKSFDDFCADVGMNATVAVIIARKAGVQNWLFIPSQ